MSGSLEAGSGQDRATEWIPLSDAAERLGCHVETLRLRVRSGDLEARRGAHGRYYVSIRELEAITRPRRMRRRVLDAAALERVQRHIDELLAEPGRLMAWQRAQVQRVRQDSSIDRPLFRVLAVRSLLAQGYNSPEIAELLGVTVRQVRRLRRVELLVVLARAWRRQKLAERVRFRSEARAIVAEIQRRLEATGFRPATRDPRRDQWFSPRKGSLGRDGIPQRVARVRNLKQDQERDLLQAGLEARQVAAISLVGIGADELHELLLNGLPSGSDPRTT